MVDQKILAEDLSKKIKYQPTYDWLLVKPLKPVVITKLLPTPPKQPATTLDDVEQQEATVPTKQKVEANTAKGIILKLGTDFSVTNPEGYAIGDIVLYPARAGFPFELLKNSRLIRRYEVIGKVIE